MEESLNKMMRTENYLMLMLSMKAKGKRVDFKHLVEKGKRDLKASQEEIRAAVDALVKKGFVEEKDGLYCASEAGRSWFAKELPTLEPELERINRPWLIVYKSKQYYPKVADTIIEFCRDHYVGFYCLFTEKRFFKRDFKGKKIVLKSPKDLLFFVDMHYIDVIPCVHRIGSNRPDWLVVDIDSGKNVKFDKVKEVAEVTYKIFERLKLNPAIKFSGSRGFQIWSKIKDFDIPESYIPFTLKTERERKKNYFTLFSDFVRTIQREVSREIPKVTVSEISEKTDDNILLDSSSMKEMGLVRAPYSVHSKTGLISLPISFKEIKNFEPEMAKIEKVIERYKKKGNEFILKESNPKSLLELVQEIH
jgi:DNA primase